MSLKRLSFTILYIVSLQTCVHAQEKARARFGKVSPNDFDLPVTPIIDSNTNAVILTDAGSTHFVGNQQGWFSYVFKKQIRIKIINKKGFDLANVKIRLYAKDDGEEKADNVSASTYNLEDGKVVETRLNKNEVFEDKIDKYHTEKRFTFPAVREGSIIEYSYTITSNFLFDLQPWEFQSENYPCLWSEYDVTIPQLLFYVLVRQGIHEFCIDKAGEGHDSYRVDEKIDNGTPVATDRNLTVSANTVKHDWAMKDIPAFHVENYISSPWNYLDKIEFQLSKTYNGQDSANHTNTWAKATEELLAREDFGKPLEEDNYWLDKLLNEVVGDASTPLEKAKAIYYYVAGHFTCTNFYDRDITSTLRDVLQKRSGTVGDLNLLLVAMLRRAFIPAAPVLLSTREHGFSLSNYPVLERLNYVIARVKIGGVVYYLDAARRQLGFGQLADNCYNGHARIISSTDSGAVYFYADSLKEKKTTMVLIVNGEKGGIEGSYQSTIDYPGSYDLREDIGRSGEKDYFKEIQAAYGEDIQISNTGIDSLALPEMPVKVYYDLKLNQAPGSDLYYFNPLFAEAYRTNPFKALERSYPVEMPYATDNLYIFNMEVPTGYTVEELPKSTRVAFNGDEGLFEYLVSNDGNQIQLRTRLKLNRAEFPPEAYSALRDFFAYVVKKESEQIVLKKK